MVASWISNKHNRLEVHGPTLCCCRRLKDGNSLKRTGNKLTGIGSLYLISSPVPVVSEQVEL
jgi:hypothetical protein